MGRGARVLRRVALVLALATATACQQAQLQAPFASQPPAQLPLQLEIPDGYRGYVVLQYALASCAILPRRDGYTVIRFADDGRACTSETKVTSGQAVLLNCRACAIFALARFRSNVTFSRSPACPTGRISPERAISPRTTHSLGTGRSDIADTNAAASP